MEYRDYYETLGLPRTASQAEIKKAFRKLAREHHPDRNAGDKAAEKRFKDVNEANAVLSDPDKRKQYDLLGANWDRFAAGGGWRRRSVRSRRPVRGLRRIRRSRRQGGQGRATSATSSAPRAPGIRGSRTSSACSSRVPRPARPQRVRATRPPSAPRAGGVGPGPSFEDILAGMGLDGAPGGSGGGSATGRTGSQAGRRGGRSTAEIEAPAELTLEEAYHGTKRLIELEGKRYEVQIPRGADTGSRVKLSGKGPNGRDVVVTVR